MEIYEETEPMKGQGKLATYVPDLGKAAPNQYGIVHYQNRYFDF